MCLVNIALNDINLDHDDFHYDDTETVVYIRSVAWCNRYQ